MTKIALVYPGQGAQRSGMGKSFYEQDKEVQNWFSEASEALGYDLSALCFSETERERLNRTAFTQPAMVAAELAMTKAVKEVLLEEGKAVSFSAGLSLGEYAAIAEAGGFTFLEAVETVAKRGALMEAAVPAGAGAMAAVLGAETELIQKVCREMDGVYIANYNCPGQLVITGYRDAVEKACKDLMERGAKRCVPLNVSGPFHSPLLRKAGGGLYEVLAKLEKRKLSHPYLANVDAGIVTGTEGLAESLVRQVSSSVLWQQSVERMLSEGVNTFIEIGPGKTLSSFIQKTAKAYEKTFGQAQSGIRLLHIETRDDLNCLNDLS